MQSYSVCPKSILEKLPHERQNYDFLWIVFMLKNNVVNYWKRIKLIFIKLCFNYQCILRFSENNTMKWIMLYYRKLSNVCVEE